MNEITPALFTFFRDLADHNEKAWFDANKARFERDVQEPLLGFIEAFKPHLARIAPQYEAIARKSGGSLFRIYRDTRFSKDPRPYKTHAGVHFRHSVGKDVHAPGIYLHLEPGQVFMGAGIWHPEPAVATRIRDAILADPDGWTAAKGARGFTGRFALAGESLKRPPRGVDGTHPLAEDLKRKDFIAAADLSEAQACAPDFLERFVADCEASAPFLAFVTRGVGLPF